MAPLSVQFTDLSRNGAASWTWDFGDGTPTSTQRNPSHVFQVGGTFPVTLTVRGNGKVDSHTLPIVTDVGLFLSMLARELAGAAEG